MDLSVTDMGSASSSFKVLLRKDKQTQSCASNGSGSANRASEKTPSKTGSFRRNAWASLVKEHSWIDLDFRERSLTKRLVPARALSLFVIKKPSIPAALVT